LLLILLLFQLFQSPGSQVCFVVNFCINQVLITLFEAQVIYQMDFIATGQQSQELLELWVCTAVQELQN